MAILQEKVAPRAYPINAIRANALKILCKQVAKMASLCFSRGKPDGRQFCGTFFGVEGFTV
ncbi:MAG: hypothetical protein ACYCTY_06075, partial [Sulfuricella sp.]